MTVTDLRTEGATSDRAQALFEEARQRRRRRWLVSGVTVAVVAVLLVLTLGLTRGGDHGRSPKPPAVRSALAASAHRGVAFALRPALCFAPPFTPAVGQPASTGSLPTCSAASRLTAANLSVNAAAGQAVSEPSADPQFSTYPSTAAAGDRADSTVLLPGTPGSGNERYVLGPAGMTRSGITSAKAVSEGDGQRVIDLDLNGRGAAEWNTLAETQFHAIVGVVIDGRVVSAPVVLPAGSSFASFGNHLQISGSFTERQAKAIASQL
jgi:hypothetical protein